MADFLFEIGLEEVPARMLAAAEAELAQRISSMLGREHLLAGPAQVESFSTPRRLAVLVHDVVSQQPDAEEDLLGPPVKAAYKDGVATAAALAFANRAGIPVDALRTVTNAKGEYLAATVRHTGKGAAEVLAAELPRELAAIYWPKSMYWRAGKPERFVRPVQWLLALLDRDIVPLTWAGRSSGRVTFGHRVLHGPEPVTIDHAAQYRERLFSAEVMADASQRRHTIRKALDRATRGVDGARWREDESLVDKVTHMTEWPSVVLGSYQRKFLQLPEEVLVTVMRDHQNNFAVGNAEGKLMPYFLAVLNTEPDARAGEIIRHGNERVIHARFNDARFFYQFDQRLSLEARVDLLNHVIFQKDLGSYGAKTGRVQAVAAALAATLVRRKHTVNLPALDTAALLAKTDLTTELVKEFTELQGIVGGLYAQAQGKGEAVARAIYDQYLPLSAGDRIPSTTEGLVLSLADKADTIGGMFGLGLQPTGSKDPFALRRAASGIVKILAESPLPLTLHEIAAAASQEDNALCRTIRGFLAERLDFYLRDAKGLAYDVVKAVMATDPDEPRDAVARAEAVAAARNSDDFAAIAAAFKRMRNILEQARGKGESFGTGNGREFLTEPAERALSEESGRLSAWVEGLRRAGEYDNALAAVATLRPHVDLFFDSVMVMTPDPKVREARLSLLQRVLNDFSKIADFSEIVVAG